MPMERTSRSPSLDILRRLEETTRSPSAATSAGAPAAQAVTSDVDAALTGRVEADPARQADARRVVGGDPAARALQDTMVAATPGAAGPSLPDGYQSLERLSKQLTRLDERFSPSTAQGRASLALALSIGGTEVYGKGKTGDDFFTRRGGTGNNMRGFAQMNLAYHRKETSTPERYAGLVADMLNGEKAMPNSEPASNHAAALAHAIAAGTVKNGRDLREFMGAHRFGGSNWQGIDDGWDRVPGLADALVDFVKHPTTTPNS
jgi:hypothetical protein